MEEYHNTCQQWLIHPSIIEARIELVKEGDLEGALETYKKAQELAPDVKITAKQLNTICWFGSLWGHPGEVLDICERAVQLAPEEGWIIDSRGLARALTGDYQGAIEDFYFYVQWAKENNRNEEAIRKREKWITELEAGRNPFDEELLEELRNE
jgi:tetratricopeptide (TPR) repeat protein